MPQVQQTIRSPWVHQGVAMNEGLWTADVAAWVQAVGTILAIICSAAIVWWQVRKQHRLDLAEARRRECQAELRFVEGVISVAVLALDRLQLAHKAWGEPKSALYFEHKVRPIVDLDLMLTALEGVKAEEASSARLSLAVFSVRKQLRLALGYLDDVALRLEVLNLGDVLERTRRSMSASLDAIEAATALLFERAELLRDELGLAPKGLATYSLNDAPDVLEFAYLRGGGEFDDYDQQRSRHVDTELESTVRRIP
jgi:cbb3-type cytochrome oxidase subunit 3